MVEDGVKIMGRSVDVDQGYCCFNFFWGGFDLNILYDKISKLVKVVLAKIFMTFDHSKTKELSIMNCLKRVCTERDAMQSTEM